MIHQQADEDNLDPGPEFIVGAHGRVLALNRLHRFLHPLFVAQDALRANLDRPGPVRTLKACFAFAAVLAKVRVMPVEAIENGLRDPRPGIHVQYVYPRLRSKRDRVDLQETIINHGRTQCIISVRQ